MSKRNSDMANAEVVEVVADISKRIDEFMSAVANLRDLEEKPDRIKDEVKQAEEEKQLRMAEFDRAMLEHEMKTIENVIEKLDKVKVDIDEYKELQALQVRESEEARAAKKKKFDEEVERRVKQELELKDLQYKKRFAEAKAKEQSFKTEKDMLHLTIDGLRSEIESQKNLTKELALKNN